MNSAVSPLASQGLINKQQHSALSVLICYANSGIILLVHVNVRSRELILGTCCALAEGLCLPASTLVVGQDCKVWSEHGQVDA